MKPAIPAAALAFALLAAPAFAQTPPEPPAPAGPQGRQAIEIDLAEADIALLVTLHADQVRFEDVPRADVRLWAEPGGEVQQEFRRPSLPRPLQPAVTYRDVNVELDAAARLDPEGVKIEVAAPQP